METQLKVYSRVSASIGLSTEACMKPSLYMKCEYDCVCELEGVIQRDPL